MDKEKILRKCAARYLRSHGFARNYWQVAVQSWWVGTSVNRDTRYVIIYTTSQKECNRLWSVAPGLQKRLEKCQVACNADRKELVVVIMLIRED